MQVKQQQLGIVVGNLISYNRNLINTCIKGESFPFLQNFHLAFWVH